MVSFTNIAMIMAASLSFVSAAPSGYAGGEGGKGGSEGGSTKNNVCNQSQQVSCCNQSGGASGLLGLELLSGQCAPVSVPILNIIPILDFQKSDPCKGLTQACCAGDDNEKVEGNLIAIPIGKCTSILDGASIL